jgi:hypothetical protein
VRSSNSGMDIIASRRVPAPGIEIRSTRARFLPILRCGFRREQNEIREALIGRDSGSPHRESVWQPLERARS